MNEIAVHTGSALAVSPEQDFWTPKQESALAQIGVEKASKADLAVFFHQCQRTGLDPFARQIYMIERKGEADHPDRDRRVSSDRPARYRRRSWHIRLRGHPLVRRRRQVDRRLVAA